MGDNKEDLTPIFELSQTGAPPSTNPSIAGAAEHAEHKDESPDLGFEQNPGQEPIEMGAPSSPTGSGALSGLINRDAPTHTIIPESMYESVSPLSETFTSTDVAYPFHLYVHGFLAMHEREKLLDLLQKENVGIRQMDLDPQFEAGRILIPQVTEYAAILIANTLKDAQVKFKLVPSDAPDTSSDTGANFSDGFSQDAVAQEFMAAEQISQDPRLQNDIADSVIVSTSGLFPDGSAGTVLDTLHASMLLDAPAIHTSQSRAYMDAIEKLKRELKLKAFHKGANGLLSLSVSLTPVQEIGKFRVTVSATAVRL